MRIGVVGAGSWGTALANHMALKEIDVDLWTREENVCRQIKEKRENEVFLPGIKLSGKIRPVRSFEEDIESRMKKVLQNLEYLAAQKDLLRLEEGGSGTGWRSEHDRFPTTSLVVDEGGTYGRDDDKDMIIEWLLSGSDNSQPSIISIVRVGWEEALLPSLFTMIKG